MIGKLKKKFIGYTMCAVIAIFTVIIIGINGLNLFRTVNELDLITQIIVNSDGHLHRNQTKAISQFSDNRDPYSSREERFMNNNKEMPFATRFFLVRLDSDMNILELDTDNIASIEKEQAEIITEELIKKHKELGWYDSMRYRLAETDGGYSLAVLDANAQIKTLLSVLGITLAVSAAAAAVLFVIIYNIAGRVIHPISESYEKQKQFITDAGHELKTPLTAISANSEILKMTYGENEWSDAIDRQTEKMRRLIIQLISLSKMDENAVSLTVEPFSLSDAAYDTADTFKSIAARRSISVKTDIEGGITITNDENAIRQIISIIMDNAVKYCSEGGTITLTLKNEKHFFVKNRILFIIANDFPDVDSFEPDKVFDRFYCGDKSHSSEGSFGLGLSIAASLAQNSGISIKADKTDGRVFFTLCFDL
ncbi:MAG: sensor histidine kinase [Oscillospiraceae bacterium]